MELIDREVSRALDAAVRLARDGMVTEALAACSLVLRNLPSHRPAWRTRAHLLARERAWTSAIASLSRIIDEVAPVPTDLLSRARWRMEAGDLEGAIVDLARLLALGADEDARRWRAHARLLRTIAMARLGLNANVLRESKGLPARASLRIAGRRWSVHDMRDAAEAALRALPRFPYAR